MRMMEFRHSQLDLTMGALNETGVPLVAGNPGSFSPAGFTDDPGMYYFVPWIGKAFGLSVDQSINVFFGSLLFIGALISIACFFNIFTHWMSRLISFIAIGMLTFAAFHYSEVYIAPFFAVTAIAPLFILWNHKSCKFNRKLISSVAYSGIIIGYTNIIRSHAGTGMLLFILLWLFLNKKLIQKEKLILSLTLLVLTALPYLHFIVLERNRDQFLIKANPLAKATTIVHPKWHSIYIGFGYLDNIYGIKYNDMVSYEKAKSVNPNVVYCSSEYEEILKGQCLSLALSDPIFVLKNLLTKSLKLFLRFIQFSNFGFLIALFYVRPSVRILLPFLFSALFYAVPGILTIPIKEYVSGMTSIATLFGMYMICLGIDKYYAPHSQKSLQATNATK